MKQKEKENIPFDFLNAPFSIDDFFGLVSSNGADLSFVVEDDKEDDPAVYFDFDKELEEDDQEEYIIPHAWRR